MLAENYISNAMTIDVEDYFHVSAFTNNVDREKWGNYESRVERNTRRILEIFEQKDLKATFFVLGWVAEKYPQVIREVYEYGHEVACHGYSHQLVYNQTEKVFREETFKAKQILEDIIQAPVYGYRAASYSITADSLWALDVLADAGFEYDSSIFPIHHDRYGIPGAQVWPHILTTPNGSTIKEFPLSTAQYMGYKIPVAGGGYFRLFPYKFIKMGLTKINKHNRKPFVFYLHPWEMDPEQPRISASPLSRFRHYNNLEKCEHRLRKLISDFKFTTIHNVLRDMELN